MTQLLEKAFAEAARLPAQEQDALAAWIIEEIESDRRWEKSLSGSGDALNHLAREALAEYAAGLTQPLDPNTL
jgi:hypothetical protein